MLNRGGRLLNFPSNEIENGTVVPGKFTAFNKNVAIGQTSTEEIKLTRKAHGYRNNWKRGDLIEKKFFSFTNSAVVEA